MKRLLSIHFLIHCASFSKVIRLPYFLSIQSILFIAFQSYFGYFEQTYVFGQFHAYQTTHIRIRTSYRTPLKFA